MHECCSGTIQWTSLRSQILHLLNHFDTEIACVWSEHKVFSHIKWAIMFEKYLRRQLDASNYVNQEHSWNYLLQAENWYEIVFHLIGNFSRKMLQRWKRVTSLLCSFLPHQRLFLKTWQDKVRAHWKQNVAECSSPPSVQ